MLGGWVVLAVWCRSPLVVCGVRHCNEYLLLIIVVITELATPRGHTTRHQHSVFPAHWTIELQTNLREDYAKFYNQRFLREIGTLTERSQGMVGLISIVIHIRLCY